MEVELVKVLLSGLTGALAGALGTWLTTRQRIRQELEANFAKDLRDQRVSAYQELWKLLEPLALFHPQSDVRYTDLAVLGVQMRKWYFTVGGLLLSTDARDAYFATQDALTEALRGAERRESPEQILRSRTEKLTVAEFAERERRAAAWEPGKDPTLDYLHVRKRASALRSALCDDLGSRAQPLVTPRRKAHGSTQQVTSAPRSSGA